MTVCRTGSPSPYANEVLLSGGGIAKTKGGCGIFLGWAWAD